MSPSERDRHELFRKLAELIGEEHAGILMRHLPPSEWPQLVTKDDLERALREHGMALRTELRAEVHGLEARLLNEMMKQSRTFVTTTVTAIVGSVAAAAAISFAAAGLA
jgi:hypothetical protein